MPTDNVTERSSVPLHHGHPPTIEGDNGQEMPCRQVLFIATGVEEAVPTGFFDSLAVRYQAEVVDPSLDEASVSTLDLVVDALAEGRPVISTRWLNTEAEREPYHHAACAAGAITCTLVFKQSLRDIIRIRKPHLPFEERLRLEDELAERLKGIEWPDNDAEDKGAVALTTFDTGKLLLIIDWSLRRRLGAYSEPEPTAVTS